MEHMEAYEYAYKIIHGIVELETGYAESRMACIDLDRNGVLIRLHIFAINMK